MAVTDLWYSHSDKSRPTKRCGVGLQWRVTVPGHPSKSFRTKGAAKAHELKLLTTDPEKAPSDLTVGDLLGPWLDGKRGLSKGGFAAAKAGAGNARARWGGEFVDQVWPHEVQAWVAAMQIDGHPASQASKSKALGALRGALDIAVSMGVIEANPAAGAKPGRAVRRDPRFLSLKQLSVLASKAGETLDGEPMVWLLGTTGLRIGECCALNVADVTRRGKRYRIRVRKSKSGKPRDVPLSKSVAAKLQLGRPEDAPLFVGGRGARLDKDTWRARRFTEAKQAAGLDLTPHDLRHTAASLMIRSGATVKDVQNALGHASAKMTLDLYGHWWDDALDDISDRMDAAIGRL